MVVDQQDGRIPYTLAGRFIRGFTEPESRGKAERTACPDAAADIELTLHQRHELSGYGKAQAGAAITPRRRHVGLRKRLEQSLLVAVAQANSGIADFEPEDDLPLRVVDHAHIEGNVAAGRELHRVAAQVDEYLPQPPGIPFEGSRHAMLDDAREFEPLRRSTLANDLRDLVQRFPEVEVDALEFELPCLDLGKVEYVVDECEQRFTGPIRDLRELPLLR